MSVYFLLSSFDVIFPDVLQAQYFSLSVGDVHTGQGQHPPRLGPAVTQLFLPLIWDHSGKFVPNLCISYAPQFQLDVRPGANKFR